MKPIFITIFILFISITSIAFADKDSEKEALKVGDLAPKFSLKDTDDKEYALEKMIGKENKETQVIVLIIGDQTTRKNGNKWAKELDKLYKDKKEAKIIMIADLRGLPFFATESMVKWGTKKENLPITILLDWKGIVSEQYGVKKGESNIYIIGNNDKIKHYFYGECSPKNIKALQMKIQENITEKK